MADFKVIGNTELNTDGVQTGMQKVGSIAKKGFGIAAGATVAATAAVVGLTKAAISSYADYEQLTGGVETLFKESSVDLIAYAKDAYVTAGMSSNKYMEIVTGFSASLLQSLEGDTAAAAEKADQAMVDMSDNANKMGTSMESITNTYQGFAKQNFTMLDNLKLGYGGTKTEMQRLLADASAISGIDYDISSYADIVDAIHTVQTEMNITGTTALEASTTISGSFTSMSAAWANLLTGMADPSQSIENLIGDFVGTVETFADNLIPVIASTLPKIVSGIGSIVNQLAANIPAILAELLPAFVESINSLVTTLAENLPAILQIFVDMIPQIIDVIITVLPLLVKAGIDIVVSLIKGLAAALPDLIPTMVTALLDVIDAIIENLDVFIEAGISIILGLVDGLIQAIPVIIEALPRIIGSIITAVIEAIPLLIEGAIALVLGLVQALPLIIMALVQALPTIIIAVVEGLVNAIPILIQGAIALIMGLVEALPLIIMALIEAIPLIITSVIEALITAIPMLIKGAIELVIGIVKALPQIILALIKAIPTIIVAIIEAFASMGTDFKNMGTDLVVGLWNGLKEKWEWLKDKAKELATGLIDGFKGIFGIESPSKEFAWIGKMNMEGLEKGMEDNNPFDQMKQNLKAGLGSLQNVMQLELNGSVRENSAVAGTSGSIINNFYDTQTSPDAIARTVGKTMTFGLARAF